MGSEISTINAYDNQGTIRQYKVMDADENSARMKKVKDENGKETIFYRKQIEKDGKPEYKYVEWNDNAEKVDISSLGDDKKSWDYGYNKAVDYIFDDVLCGIDSSKPCDDGKKDGVITFGEKMKHLWKGILSPVKAMIKHPLLTIAGIAATTALVAAAPIMGPILLGVGAVLGGATLINGALRAYFTKSDAEAREAWENIGSGTLTTLLSLIGIRKMNKGLVGRSDAAAKLGRPAPKVPTPSPTATTPTPTPTHTPPANHHGSTGLYAKCEKVVQTAEKAGEVAKDVLNTGWKGVKATGKAIIHPKDTTKALLETAQKYTPPKPADCLRGYNKQNPYKADSVKDMWHALTANMGAPFNGSFDGLKRVALQQIHDGHHYKASRLVSYMNHCIKDGITNGSLTGDKLAEANKALETCQKLLSTTRFLNNGPWSNVYKESIYGSWLQNLPNSATLMDELKQSAYTVKNS